MDTDRENSGHTAVWAITPRGINLGVRICRGISPSSLFIPEAASDVSLCATDHFSLVTYTKLSAEIHRRFTSYPYHIFIFATGIAVRILAPILNKKTSDPAVVVMDETGQFAISLVSGHLGGANDLAHRAAAVAEALPVITTATDTNHLPSIDMVAKHKDLHIETPENIKRVNMKFLRGIPVSIIDPGGYLDRDIPSDCIDRSSNISVPDIFCSYTSTPVPRETMILRPRVLCLGVGCNRNTPAEEILDLIEDIFKTHDLSLFSIKEIGSSRVKEDEQGLIEAAGTLGCSLVFYDKEDLNGVETIKNPSKMAQKHLGVRSVCEAAAILGAQLGPLMVPKQKTKNVTVALALSEKDSLLWERGRVV